MLAATHHSEDLDDLLDGMTDGAAVAPDGLFSRGARLVVDASHVQSVLHEGLHLVPVAEVFARGNTVFLGFGVPNVFLAVPGTDGWEKFAATMFWRQRSFVADTRGRVQGGIFVELRDLSADAASELRTAMNELQGRRSITCARANARVLDAAGFTSGGRSLRRCVRPMALARRIWEHGLEHRGTPITLRVIRTSNRSLSDHFTSVISKEATSLGRLAKKQLMRVLPHRSAAAPAIEPRLLAPLARSEHLGTAVCAELRMGRPSKLGALIGARIGDHPIFEAIPDPAAVDLNGLEFADLNAPLPAYPGRLDALTRLKKHLLFAPTPVRFIRKQLAQEIDSIGTFTGANLAQMLQTRPGEQPFLYNVILTGSTLRMARVENRTERDVAKANWLLSKHVLIAGYDPDVRFAGEVWVEDSLGGRIVHVNNNSGTYKPTAAQTRAAARFIEQGLGVTAVAHPLGD